jgi:quercetin dioxygenase-like cupin family protein
MNRLAARVVAASVAACLIAATYADTPTPAQAKRTILDRHDLSGVDGKEVILGTAELPAGAVIAWHIHYGDESGYVLKGHLILKVKGQPDRALKAGDFFFNPAGLVHSLAAEPGTDGGTALSTWIVAKGKPLAEPVADGT